MSSTARHVHCRHEDGRWVSSDLRRGQSIALISVSGSLAVDDIYRDGLEDI